MSKIERKRTNNDLQNIEPKIKDRVTRNALKSLSELGYSGSESSSCFTCDLFTYTGVQHDLHIRRCLCRLTVTR
jgi:hypothetical protein